MRGRLPTSVLKLRGSVGVDEILFELREAGKHFKELAENVRIGERQISP